MKGPALGLGLSAAFAACSATSEPGPSATGDAGVGAGDGGNGVAPAFALVELFTSEGCSSCPPAEQTLNGLATDPTHTRAGAYEIAWHVDYWDYLGWKDRFASPQFTTRQKQYAAAQGKQGIGTPNLLVNGIDDPAYGTNLKGAEAEITTALGTPGAASLSLGLVGARDAASLTVHVRSDGAPPASKIYVVIVERGFSVMVTAGENNGKTLTHDNVARALAVTDSTDSDVVLTPPPDVNRSHADVIAFVQDPKTMALYAVARIPVGPK